jgi:hypothetical protein
MNARTLEFRFGKPDQVKLECRNQQCAVVALVCLRVYIGYEADVLYLIRHSVIRDLDPIRRE